MTDGDPDEPGVDVTDLLADAYEHGRRDAFTDCAELVAMAGGMFSAGSEMGMITDPIPVVLQGLRALVVMLRRRADPDAKPPEVVGDE